jgi:CheY-like chemotaxis protein
MQDVKALKAQAKGLTLLYVEDNQSLRENASKLFRNLFETVDSAEDGAVGLDLFKKNHYPIVITDIKMPNLDGIELASKIKKIKPETKIIVMSAHDDKESLLKFIELGISNFVKKPVNISELTDILYACVKEIKHEKDTALFYMHLKSIFNYQSSMVVMLEDAKPILANQIFLDFFNVQTIEEFRVTVKDIGSKFMPHDGFLYEDENRHWLELIRLKERRLFHVKMKSPAGSIKHFILKYQAIPEKNGHGILSFDDVTELNLLKLFDAKESSQDNIREDTRALHDLLEVIQRNSAKIELHNYYKGLSITNDAVITKVKADVIELKTTYMQQKAIQHEQRTIIISEALPKTLSCAAVVNITFEKQTVELKDLSFVESSPITRKTVRVVPDGKQTTSIFLGKNKFQGDVTIDDISLDAVKLKLDYLPPGLAKGSEVTLDMVLELDKKPLIINTKAKLLRKSESMHSFNLVFLFENVKRSELVKYITKRQMAIIREFKGLNNG